MKTRRAFTLVELVIVFGLLLLIVGTMVIATVKFVRQRELEVVTQTLVSYLRTGYVRASQSEGNVSHGVSRADSKLTLFRGASYATKNAAFDIIFPYPSYIQFSGLTDVVFAKQTGAPSATGTFTVTDGNTVKTVTVYSTGAVSR